MSRPQLAWLSPLPPVRSGVSEYASDLVPTLATGADLRLFAELPATGTIAGIEIEPPERFDQTPGWLPIYHMGNNLHHRFVARRAALRPGVLVLHDIVLHHYWIEETLAAGRREDYLGLMTETYGELGAEAARARADDVASQTEYFAFPLFESLASASRGVLVHNRRAARLVKGRVEGVPVGVVPMGIPGAAEDPLPGRAEARARLGIAPDDYLVGLFGFLTPIKRPEVCLSAFRNVSRSFPGARLVALGEASPAVKLEARASALGIADRVVAPGYLDYPQLKTWIAAVDVFLNLRYPTAGETSASLLRLLGWGKPVVLSDYAQFREIPAEAALSVSLGPSEEAELAAILTRLGQQPGLGRALGEAAARFVVREHSLAGAARAYLDFLGELGPESPRPAGRMRSLRGGRSSRTPRRPAARIEPDPFPAVVLPGTRLRIGLNLTNTGDTTLLRWWTVSGGHAAVGVVAFDDAGAPLGELGHFPLPRDLAPGEALRMEVRLDMPPSEGRVVLLFDLCIEAWGWLRHRGAEAVLIPVDVRGRV